MSHVVSSIGVALLATVATQAASLEFTVRLETVLEHDDGKFLWYHPRAAPLALPGRTSPADTPHTPRP